MTPRSSPTPRAILSRSAAEVSGQCFLDSEVLAAEGMHDLSRYGGGESPKKDLFVD